jgi:hypothetical protein
MTLLKPLIKAITRTKTFVFVFCFLGALRAAGAAEGILDYNRFMRDIEPLLTTTTYNSPAALAPVTCFYCHGDPANPAFSHFSLKMGESRHNFVQAGNQIEIANPESSNLLLKPLALAAGGVEHGLAANDAGEQLPSSNDPRYQIILKWVQDATRASQGARVSATEPHPNPFRFTTDLIYFLTTEALHVDVTIFATNGKQVRNFIGTLNVGANRVRWDGRDEDGELLNTGVYFYSVKAQFDDGTDILNGRVVFTP